MGIRDITARNVAKVTRFREGGEEELERTVRRLETVKGLGIEREEVEGDEAIEGKEEVREEWDSYPRFRERLWKREADQRESKSWQEKRDERRRKRDPDSGRRTKMALH